MTHAIKLLTSVFLDLQRLRSAPPPCDGTAEPRAEHRIARENAAKGVVRCDATRWLGRPLTPSDRVANSRAYADLARRGLIDRIGATKAAKGYTAWIRLTPEGEALAAALLADATARAVNTADVAAPAANVDPDELLATIFELQPTAAPSPVAFEESELAPYGRAVDDLARAGMLTIPAPSQLQLTAAGLARAIQVLRQRIPA
jgi:hypothetical protein